MKKVALLLASSLLLVTSLFAEKTSTEICQTYIKQVKDYKKSMGNDEMSKKTLAFYEEKRTVFCGNLAAKVEFEKKSFLEMMAKSKKNTTKECKEAIDMASAYSKTKNKSALIFAAHKENIVDNCGRLVASHVTAYCLWDEAK
jgi:predicted solute-binding protein